jgi:hypothetical protein
LIEENDLNILTNIANAGDSISALSIKHKERTMIRKSVYFVMALAALFGAWTTLNVSAQVPGGFSQIDMQCGGYYSGMIQHRSGRLYGRTDGGGVYMSDNGGFNWTYLSGNMYSYASMCVAGIGVPQSPTSSSNVLIFVAGSSSYQSDTNCGIWLTTNAGANWTQTKQIMFWGNAPERQGGEPVYFNPSNDLEVWVGTHANGLLKSADGGNTWSQVASVTNTLAIVSMYIHPLYTNIIWMAGDNGVWVSTNHGGNWNSVYNSSTAVIYRITGAPDGTMYFGGTNGSAQVLQKITSTNWNYPTNYVLADLSSAYNSGATAPNDDDPITCVTVLRSGWLVAGEYGNDRLSTNGGTNFSNLGTTLVAGTVQPQWSSRSGVYQPQNMVQDVVASNTWYTSFGWGAARTDNGGSTWQYIVNGIGELCTEKVGFHPTDPNRIGIPCGDVGGATVIDGGTSGSTVSMLKPFFTADGMQCTHRALLSASNGVNRYIFPGNEEYDNRARIYCTTNDGTNWYYPGMIGLPTNNGGTYGQMIVEAVASLDNPDDYLVVCGGTNWTNAGGVYRTTNAGNNFTQCNWYINNTDSLGNGSYWFVWLDDDAVNMNTRYMFGHVTFPGNPSSGSYANTGGGFYISYDRGVDWTQLSGATGALIPGDWNDWIGQMSADHGVSGSVWVALQTSGTANNGLAHSYNGGTNFYAVPGFYYAEAVDALSNNVVVLGEMTGDTWNKIYYSTNNGTNWTEVTRPNYRFGNAVAVALDPHWPGRIYIASQERSIGIFVPAGARFTPTVTTWPTAATITYGQTLASSILSGGSPSTGGSFAFTTPSTVPGSGTTSQSVTFTPTNTTFYSNVVSTVSVTVNPLPVVLTGTETYNGSTSAAASVLSVSNKVGSDNVSVTGSATMSGQNVGTNAITSATGLTLGGTQATNYTLTGASGSVIVTALPVILTGTENYKGSTSVAASVLSVANVVGSDNVSVASGSATMASPYIGANAITSAAGLTLGGSKATNYTLTGASGSVTVTALPVVLTGTENYNGSTSVAATVLTVSNLVSGDVVGPASGSATIASPYVGTEAITSAAGLTLAGAKATNYTVSGASGSVVVNPRAVVLAGTQTYNGTATAAASTLSITDVVGGDNVSVASGSATMASPNVGNNAIMSATGLLLGGAQATNYTVSGASGSVTVTALPVILTGTENYNGSTSVAASVLSVSNVIGGDNVNVAGSATIASPNAGTNAITSVASLTLGGAKGTNYTVNGASGSVIVTRLPVVLTGTETYNGSATVGASVLSVSNVVGSDNVSVASGSATMASPNVGTNAIASATGLTLGGTQAPNYTVSGASGSVTVTPVTVVLTGTENYNGSTNVAASVCWCRM